MSDRNKVSVDPKGKLGAASRSWFFALVVIIIYITSFVLVPEKTLAALGKSWEVGKQVAGPVSLAFVMMLLLNRFLSPAVAVKYLGRQAGMKGILLSSLSGILSMGPIYAWYPLLGTLKGKGVSTFHLANFIACRSIKPVLLPLLIAYFGWYYSSLFIAVNLIGALLAAGLVHLFCLNAE